MTKKPEDELVTKGVVKKLLANKSVTQFMKGNRIVFEGMVLSELWEAIDQLPAVEIKPPEQIERVILLFDLIHTKHRHSKEGLKKFKQELSKFIADLLRWILNQEQNTWTDEELLG